MIAGLGMMGCIPSILAQNSAGKCSQDVNNLVNPFNANVKTMINRLNNNLPGARFIYVDTARMFQDILASPRSYGTVYIKISPVFRFFIYLFINIDLVLIIYYCDSVWQGSA